MRRAHSCDIAAQEVRTPCMQCLTGGLQPHDPRFLQHWLVSRQMSHEGGFQGRANKLVDGCYSFWQGGAFAVLKMVQDGYQHKELKFINMTGMLRNMFQLFA